MKIDIQIADYADPSQAQDLVSLLNAYAQDPMGGGKALSKSVQSSLVDGLAAVSNAFSILCYVDAKPAGLINCFQAFSTFKSKPLINIHDVIVLKQFRGMGVSQLMLEKVEAVALDRGCCKLTLEILEGNEAAMRSYQKFGFEGYELDPKMGKALFWEKSVVES